MWKREAIVACFSSPTPAQSATSSGDVDLAVDPVAKERDVRADDGAQIHHLGGRPRKQP